MGLCLHESLAEHAVPFHLWVVCMDELVFEQISLLKLPNLTPIRLSDIEDNRLKQVKSSRTKGEYCWTLTPFAPEAVFKLAPDAKRVTYLDADLFFFDSPDSFFEELELSGKHVLITEHAYAPEYEFNSETSGKFCVQFMTFLRTQEAFEVMQWWQERCLEWCYARFEDGKFGDQKYLDSWPEIFSNQVHVLKQTTRTLAPWNVRYLTTIQKASFKPVIYHFHALRILSPSKVKLFESYKVGRGALILYKQYINSLNKNIVIMVKHGMLVPCLPENNGFVATIRKIKGSIYGTRYVQPLDYKLYELHN
jgi:hypothetical protein